MRMDDNMTSKERFSTTSRDSFLQSFQKLAYDFIESAITPQNSLTFDEEKIIILLFKIKKDKFLDKSFSLNAKW